MVVLLPITLWSGTERLLLTSTITRMGYGIIPHQLGPVAPMADLTAEVATHKGCSLGDTGTAGFGRTERNVSMRVVVPWCVHHSTRGVRKKEEERSSCDGNHTPHSLYH
jgi:hypothetical protein